MAQGDKSSGIKLNATLNVDTSRGEKQIRTSIDRVNRSISKGGPGGQPSLFSGKKFKLQLDDRGFSLPLGRIRGDVTEFDKSLAASTARVLAFGASTVVLQGIKNAFKEIVTQTVAVEQSLKNVNVILNTSTDQLEKFGRKLFDIAKNTEQSFNVVVEAAVEFSRQGLSVEETLRRTNDALVLTRLSAFNSVKAVEALTAAVNGFSNAALTTTEVVNKFANVDAAFAVSADDLAEGLARAGASAQDANVSFDELLALITSTQQTTARGGNIIGNAFKSIFTRISRTTTIDQLRSLGVEIEQSQSGVEKLKSLANALDEITDEGKASKIKELAGGVFQINIVSAALRDLGKDISIFDQALATSINTTDEAIKRNAELNKTLSALANQSALSIQELAAQIGELSFTDSFKNIFNEFNSIISSVSDLLASDNDSIGGQFAKTFIEGVGKFLTGPGFVIFAGVIVKLLRNTAGFAAEAFNEILGANRELERQQGLQKVLVQFLETQQTQVLDLINSGKSRTEIESQLAGIFERQVAAQEKLNAAAKRGAALPALRNFELGSVGIQRTKGSRPSAAQGYIPNAAGGIAPSLMSEKRAINSGVGGASPSANPVLIPNFNFGKGKVGPIVANTDEFIIPNFQGRGSAIFNKDMINSVGGKSVVKNMGGVPIFAKGKIPNFAEGVSSLRILNKTKNPSTQDIFDLGNFPDIALLHGNLGQGRRQVEAIATPQSIGINEQVFGKLSGKKRDRAQGRLRMGLSEIPLPSGVNQDFSTIFLNSFVNTFTSLVERISKGTNIGVLPKIQPKQIFDASGGPQVIGRVFEAVIQRAVKPSNPFNSNMSGFDFVGSEAMSGLAKLYGSDVISGVRLADAKISPIGSGVSDSTMIQKFFQNDPRGREMRVEVINAISSRANSVGAIRGRPQKFDDFFGGKKRNTNAARGFIPNFADLSQNKAIQEAIQRELDAGIPLNQIQLDQSNKLVSPNNPLGLAIINKRDEPLGVGQGISRSLIQGENPKSAGIPNFAPRKAINKSLGDILASSSASKTGIIQPPPLPPAAIAKQTGATENNTNAIKKLVNTLTKRRNLGFGRNEKDSGLLPTKRSGLFTGGIGLPIALSLLGPALKNAAGGSETVGGAVQGASVGALLGPKGALAGAAIGGLSSFLKETDEVSNSLNKVTKELEELSSTSTQFANTLSGVIKNQSDLDEALASGDARRIATVQNQLFKSIAEIEDPALRDLAIQSKTDTKILSDILLEMQEANQREIRSLELVQSILADQKQNRGVIQQATGGRISGEKLREGFSRFDSENLALRGNPLLNIGRALFGVSTGRKPSAQIDILAESEKVSEEVLQSSANSLLANLRRQASTLDELGNTSGLDSINKVIEANKETEDSAKQLGRLITLSTGSATASADIIEKLSPEQIENFLKKLQDGLEGVTEIGLEFIDNRGQIENLRLANQNLKELYNNIELLNQLDVARLDSNFAIGQSRINESIVGRDFKSPFELAQIEFLRKQQEINFEFLKNSQSSNLEARKILKDFTNDNRSSLGESSRILEDFVADGNFDLFDSFEDVKNTLEEISGLTDDSRFDIISKLEQIRTNQSEQIINQNTDIALSQSLLKQAQSEEKKRQREARVGFGGGISNILSGSFGQSLSGLRSFGTFQRMNSFVGGQGPLADLAQSRIAESRVDLVGVFRELFRGSNTSMSDLLGRDAVGELESTVAGSLLRDLSFLKDSNLISEGSFDQILQKIPEIASDQVGKLLGENELSAESIAKENRDQFGEALVSSTEAIERHLSDRNQSELGDDIARILSSIDNNRASVDLRNQIRNNNTKINRLISDIQLGKRSGESTTDLQTTLNELKSTNQNLVESLKRSEQEKDEIYIREFNKSLKATLKLLTAPIAEGLEELEAFVITANGSASSTGPAPSIEEIISQIQKQLNLSPDAIIKNRNLEQSGQNFVSDLSSAFGDAFVAGIKKSEKFSDVLRNSLSGIFENLARQSADFAFQGLFDNLFGDFNPVDKLRSALTDAAEGVSQQGNILTSSLGFLGNGLKSIFSGLFGNSGFFSSIFKSVVSAFTGGVGAANGGMILKRAAGGGVPTLTMGGEFYANPNLVNKMGSSFFDSVNRGQMPQSGFIQGGTGVKDDVFGLLPQGSYVVNKHASNKFRDVLSGLESPQKFGFGGSVGKPIMSLSRAGGGMINGESASNGINVLINMDFHVNNGSLSTSISSNGASRQEEDTFERISKRIVPLVKGVINDELKPGGMINQRA